MASRARQCGHGDAARGTAALQAGQRRVGPLGGEASVEVLPAGRRRGNEVERSLRVGFAERSEVLRAQEDLLERAPEGDLAPRPASADAETTARTFQASSLLVLMLVWVVEVCKRVEACSMRRCDRTGGGAFLPRHHFGH